MSTDLTFSNQFHDYGLPYKLASSLDQFMANIFYLEQKIAATTKRITYWDLYKITSVLTDSNSFHSAINNLSPYSSLIVNTKGSTGKEDYNPGDIFVKHNDGTYEHISAERGGIFYPSQITKASGEKNNTYTIKYSYQAAAPKEENKDSSKSGNTYTCAYAKHMKYIDITGGLVGSPYNMVYTKEDLEDSEDSSIKLDFPTNPDYDEEKDDISLKEIEVEPIVKCFTTTNSDQLEEVYCDISITSDKTDETDKKYIIKIVDESALGLITRMVVK